MYAGYLWRQEREMDRVALVMLAALKAAGAKSVTPRKLLGRELGESKVPGYIVPRR